MRADSRAAEEAEGAVPDEDKKRAAHRGLVDRVLNGEGRASAEQRARAFGNDGLSPPLHALIGKVVTRPAQVTEADFAAAKASGFSEDQLFELVICAAVGQTARLYEAGLAALAEATVDGEADNAT
jgi:alkylhydroperoxidase family enzyme